MLLLIGILLAIFVLPSPWGLVAIGIGAALDICEGLIFLWWSKRKRARVGAPTLVGRRAVVVTPVAPRGQVKLDGEIWEARSAEVLDRGAEVVVVGVDRLVLDVASDV
jgi:membrane protein implicated in regulation of membrane protease activity